MGLGRGEKPGGFALCFHARFDKSHDRLYRRCSDRQGNRGQTIRPHQQRYRFAGRGPSRCFNHCNWHAHSARRRSSPCPLCCHPGQCPPAEDQVRIHNRIIWLGREDAGTDHPGYAQSQAAALRSGGGQRISQGGRFPPSGPAGG